MYANRIYQHLLNILFSCAYF